MVCEHKNIAAIHVNENVKQAQDDLDFQLMISSLRCTDCGAIGFIDYWWWVPPGGTSMDTYEWKAISGVEDVDNNTQLVIGLESGVYLGLVRAP